MIYITWQWFPTGYEMETDTETSAEMDRVRRETYETLPSTCCTVGCRTSDLVRMCWETQETSSSSLCKMPLYIFLRTWMTSLKKNSQKVKMVLKLTFQKRSDVVFHEILQMQTIILKYISFQVPSDCTLLKYRPILGYVWVHSNN